MLSKSLTYLCQFVFWYPLFMSTIWIIGGILFYQRREQTHLPELTEYPMVSILIPCYNEEETVVDTITHLQDLNYPHYEIIAINDGSKDNTIDQLRKLGERFTNLRVIHLGQNAGKANALHLGLMASNGEILVCIDADAVLDANALRYLVPHFTTPHFGERVGAVTGNPRIRNRSSLLARVQVCEFSSIIGLIKRSQRILGKIMTVSGVIAAFRKSALLDCDLWDRDIITEDIGVTWKLQKRFWDVRYEPRALCWMLVPETVKGYWNQRVRWAQGGIEAILKHGDIFKDWRQRRLMPVYIEQVLSIFWALAWMLTTVILTLGWLNHGKLYFPILWTGTYLSLICVIQFFVAMVIDRKYDPTMLKYYLWAIWYPAVYWYFNALVVIWAIPKALRRKNGFAVWDSPDRGIGL